MKRNRSEYNHRKIEAKWREVWEKAGTYEPDLQRARKPRRSSSRGKPFYNLMMFPYPSAEGLHVGNMYAFTGADVYGRFQRMRGYDVFEPIGLDGFGIHSENYAIKIGKHPAEQAKVSEKRFYHQLHEIGNGFSWKNKLETYDPDYYKWTQWLFVEMFKHGLAYKKPSLVNWCPSCKTVLSDEQVEGGVCERCKTPVEKKQTEQWFFRITDYAQRLLDNIEKIDWPEKIKIAQRQWIGRKEGINITFKVKNTTEKIEVFTTAPTNWGASFMVLAPECDLVKKILANKVRVPKKNYDQVKAYVKQALKKTEQQRRIEVKDKTGVDTGLKAINHVTGEEIPVWISDFVLIDVGTGAIQACPGHDVRDFEFAKKFGLPIPRVVVGSDGDNSTIKRVEQVITSDMPGKMVNSDFINGLSYKEGLQKTMDYFEEKGWGKRVVDYRLRDWCISRQRYWGPPIPMVYCEACARDGAYFKGSTLQGGQAEVGKSDTFKGSTLQGMAGWWPVPEEELPVELPYVKDYKPTGDGKSPLEKASKEWLYTKCPECGGKAKRETDVSDTFLDSAWYFLRYPSVGKTRSRNEKSNVPGTEKLPWDSAITKKWLPVDAYIGGAEHAVLHLLYSRFTTMALYDWKHLEFEEPFPFLYSHGLIIKDGAKMSKSRGNIVNPDEYINKYGSDTLRSYMMFLGKYNQGGDFRDSGIAGMRRFLNRVWRIFQNKDKIKETTPKDHTKGRTGGQANNKKNKELISLLHRTIKKVTGDIGKFKYNTAIAAMMEFINEWEVTRNHAKGSHQGADRRTGKKQEIMNNEDKGKFLKLMAPFAPHMAEELYQVLRKSKVPPKRRAGINQKSKVFDSIHLQPWPEWDEALVKLEEVEIPVQVNGKLRGTITISSEKAKDKEAIVSEAKRHERVIGYLKEKKIKKTIWVPGRLVNFVV